MFSKIKKLKTIFSKKQSTTRQPLTLQKSSKKTSNPLLPIFRWWKRLTISLRVGISALIIIQTTLATTLLTFVFYNATERVALQFGNQSIINLKDHTTSVINSYFRNAEKQMLDNHATLMRFLSNYTPGTPGNFSFLSDPRFPTTNYTTISEDERKANEKNRYSDSTSFSKIPTPIGESKFTHDILNFLLERTENISSIYVGFETGGFIMARRMPDGSSSIRQVHINRRETTEYWHHENPIYYFNFPPKVTSSDGEGYDPRKRGWYRSTVSAITSDLHRKSVWSEPYIFASDRKIGMTLSRKIVINDKVIGVLAVDLPLESISEFVSDFDLVKNQKGLIFLTSPKEVIIALSKGMQDTKYKKNEVVERKVFKVTGRENGVPIVAPIKVYESSEALVRGAILTKPNFFNYKEFFKGSLSEDNMKRIMFEYFDVSESSYLSSFSTKLYDETAKLIINSFALSDAKKDGDLIFSKTEMQDNYGIFQFGEELYLSHAVVIYPSKWFPLTMGMVVPYEMIAGPLRSTLNLILATTLFMFVMSIIIAMFIARRISTPLMQISKDMNKIRNFQLDSELDNKKQAFTELREMRNSFDSMKRGLVSFKKFVPTEIVSRLVKQGIEADVGGKNIEITTLFSDITEFTKLTEETKSDQLIEQLHQYFNIVSKTIDFHSGTLDKYIGDSVMAIWGAPVPMSNHAVKACFAALNCHEVIDQMNITFKKKGLSTLETRIGINTGEAIVGNIGSDARLNYTAIGDSVNLASRLENINKLYGTRIIISHHTYLQTKDFIEARPLDKVAVYGKKIIIPIYELVAKKNEATPTQKRIIDMSEQAFHFIEAKRWSSAIRELRAVKSLSPLDKTSDLLIERCYRYIEDENEIGQTTFAYNADSK